MFADRNIHPATDPKAQNTPRFWLECRCSPLVRRTRGKVLDVGQDWPKEGFPSPRKEWPRAKMVGRLSGVGLGVRMCPRLKCTKRWPGCNVLNAFWRWTVSTAVRSLQSTLPALDACQMPQPGSLGRSERDHNASGKPAGEEEGCLLDGVNG